MDRPKPSSSLRITPQAALALLVLPVVATAVIQSVITEVFLGLLGDVVGTIVIYLGVPLLILFPGRRLLVRSGMKIIALTYLILGAISLAPFSGVFILWYACDFATVA